MRCKLRTKWKKQPRKLVTWFESWWMWHSCLCNVFLTFFFDLLSFLFVWIGDWHLVPWLPVWIWMQLPQTGRASMSVVEVDDPQLIILLHFMTPFMAIQPVFESPLARPASLQGSMASQLLIDLLRDRPGAHGMLLVSIEQDGKFLIQVRRSH